MRLKKRNQAVHKSLSLNQAQHFRRDGTLQTALSFIQRLSQGCQVPIRRTPPPTLADHSRIKSCCRKYTKGEIPFTRIRGYSIQTVRTFCNIDAIIFHTSIGRNVCADPSQNWVMETIHKLK
ncbi:C-C motif chemokine 20a.3 isoform X2 [Pygocentrus nattereri]|nr:C-C motif chemokine 20a.3 isoform X2 [Pygocentrus nattereri]